MKRSIINKICKKELRDKACKELANWFYDARLPFNAVNHDSFRIAMERVVTDNASSYKAQGKLLMEKRKHLYWTPRAAHCIDLMLEDIEKIQRPQNIESNKEVSVIQLGSLGHYIMRGLVVAPQGGALGSSATMMNKVGSRSYLIELQPSRMCANVLDMSSDVRDGVPPSVVTYASLHRDQLHSACQLNLSGARAVLRNTIGFVPKDKIFKKYIEIEQQLGNMDRCRKLYEKYLEWSPENCYA
ncbi:crooked neck-like protein 1 [Tanacetum coccineum]